MKKDSEIFCTLGPSTINRNFLKFSNKKISLLRLNMSHVKIDKLEKSIKFIRKFSKVPICIDTEGAQIRTKVKRGKNYKNSEKLTIYKNKGNFKIYPKEVFDKMKKGDILCIGFDALKAKIIKKNAQKIFCTILSGGKLANNKGVSLSNRKIKLNFITEKDRQAIDIAKKMNINFYALSFTNSYEDILKFNKLLEKKVKIFKIETKAAIQDLNKIISNGSRFLIDRGDLSKELSVELLPQVQKQILKLANLKKKKVYVATNFLESMVKNKYPTLGEANDIYNTLKDGASGLVLAAETAVGKYPKECVVFLTNMIKTYKRYK